MGPRHRRYLISTTYAGVPTRVATANHGTGRAMLERTYSRHICDHADGLARKALLDTTGSERERPLRLVS